MMFDIGFDLTLCSEMCTRVLRAARHQSFKRAARQVCTRHQRWCKYTFGFIDTQHLLTGHFIRYHILPGPHLLFYALIGMYIVYFGHLQRSLAQTSSEPIISMMSRPKNNCCIDAAADVGSWWLALIKLLYVEYIFVISKSFLGVCSRPWGLQST